VRELHVVGVSDDGTSLLLGSSEDGKVSHRIPIDDRLRSAVRGHLPVADRVESALPPREIQARLRAGDTPEAVAKAAGVPVARVLPYAAPVEAERQRIVGEARGASVRRPRGPASTTPMGELVDARLQDVSGLKEDTVEWSAARQADGDWLVSLRYAARGGRRSASWLWHPVQRELTAADLAASRLSSDDRAVARRSAPKAVKRTGAKPTASAPARKPAPRRKAKQASRAKTTAPRTPTPVATETAGASGARRGTARVPIPSWSDVLLGVQPPPRDATAARQRPAARRRKG